MLCSSQRKNADGGYKISQEYVSFMAPWKVCLKFDVSLSLKVLLVRGLRYVARVLCNADKIGIR